MASPINICWSAVFISCLQMHTHTCHARTCAPTHAQTTRTGSCSRIHLKLLMSCLCRVRSVTSCAHRNSLCETLELFARPMRNWCSRYKLVFADCCFQLRNNYLISAKMALPKHQLTKLERAVFVFTGVAKRGKVPREARLACFVVASGLQAVHIEGIDTT